MTGGRIQKVRRYLNESPFMVSYGDTVADIDIGRLLEFHRSHGKIATVSAVRPASRFGVMELNSSGGVGNFAEKPRLEGWVSAGFFVFEPGIFDYLDGDQCILERAPLERLVADNQLMAYQHSGAFYVMDTYREYRDLNDLWDQGRAPWKRWED
jgi:glucose-1-phosphate cytidylyltransferase